MDHLNFAPASITVQADSHQTQFRAFGELGKNKVNPKTIFDVASLTKAIVTATIIHKLLEQNQLQLNQTLADFLPQANYHLKKLTIKDILSYQVEFDFRASALKELSTHDIWKKILSAPVISVGQKNQPVNLHSLLLTKVIEVASSSNLKSLFEEIVVKPLGLKRTFLYQVPAQLLPETVPTEIDDWRQGMVLGLVHDELSWTLVQNGQNPGSAGLFSPAEELLTILKAIFINQVILQPKTITLLWQNAAYQNGLSTSLGWERNQSWMGWQTGQANVLGKTGFTGCSCCVAQSGQISILLSNVTYPQRTQDRSELQKARIKLHATQPPIL